MRVRNVLLGVCGGISAYKSAELTRALVKSGAQVRVVMTENACEFITPLTMQTLSRNRVYLDTFASGGNHDVTHISLAEFANVAVIAPATANIIGKLANGIADDILSTVAMVLNVPILLYPAMNEKMWNNPIVQENIAKLKRHGFAVMDTGVGELACNAVGAGRMAEVEDIVQEMENILAPKDMLGEVVLVSAGPTREALDPVRFISNHSTGKMGFAVAQAAQRRGASVILVSGPTHLKAPPHVRMIPVSSAVDMQKAMLEHFNNASIVIKAAAVADYRPAQIAKNKIKKGDAALSISLEQNPDILAQLGATKGKKILVGFAMETEGLIGNAKKKLKAKNLDFVVANSLVHEGAGFAVDTNIAKIIDNDGAIEDLPLMSKMELANIILDRAVNLKNKSGKRKDGNE